jgi:hypothetical protein
MSFIYFDYNDFEHIAIRIIADIRITGVRKDHKNFSAKKMTQRMWQDEIRCLLLP